MLRTKQMVLVLVLLFVAMGLFAQVKEKINLEISPNPVKEQTNISVISAKSCTIMINIYDEKDMLKKTVFVGSIVDGVTNFTWDGTDNTNTRLPQGKYVVILSGDDKFTSVKKIIILK